MNPQIQAFAAAVNASFDAIDAAHTSLETSVIGVADDVTFLKETIDALQNNPGPISTEDQALLDAAQARATAAVGKAESLKTALATLDEATMRPIAPE